MAAEREGCMVEEELLQSRISELMKEMEELQGGKVRGKGKERRGRKGRGGEGKEEEVEGKGEEVEGKVEGRER